MAGHSRLSMSQSCIESDGMAQRRVVELGQKLALALESRMIYYEIKHRSSLLFRHSIL